MRKILCLLTIPILFLSTAIAEEPQYTDQTFARLSFMNGNVYVQRAAELEYEEGVMNMPLSEGDRLGTTEGRAEVYLGKGNFIRLDNNAKLDFSKLPRRDEQLTQINVWAGNIYFSIKNVAEEKSIEIHTPDVSLYVLEEGLYRIDVRQDSETEIFVFSGLLEAAGSSGSVLVKDARRLEAIDGQMSSPPSRFMAVAEDSFDRWSEQRESQIRQEFADKYLPEELGDFEYELNQYGEWAYVPPYGHVWVPGGVDPDWRPYYYGRWLWYPLCGWTWLSYEPWGWATYHYGRWHWGMGLGWYWIPTPGWGPCWVDWYWGYDYFGWVPLSYYGYPGVIINNIYYPRYRDAYYPPQSRAITVIHKDQLKQRDVSKVALRQESVQKVGKITLSKSQPEMKLERSKISVGNFEGKRLLIRKSDGTTILKQEKPSVQAPDKVRIPENERKIRIDTPRSEPSSEERKISKIGTRYPSSPKISIDRNPTTSRTKKSSSFLGRVYDYISKGKSSITRTRSSGSSSSKASSSRTRTRSTSSGRSSSSRSSSSSGSSSSKVKKK